MRPREIYIVRHTTPDVAKGVCYGQSDLSLATGFEQEFERVLAHIPAAIGRLYTSPLRRCRQLAQHIGDQRGVAAHTDARLLELNFGAWELQPWDALNGPALTAWMDDYVNVACPGGESYQMLADRVKAFCLDVEADTSWPVVIVAHGGSIKSMLAHWQHVSLLEAMSVSITYGQVIHITLPNTAPASGMLSYTQG